MKFTLYLLLLLMFYKTTYTLHIHGDPNNLQGEEIIRYEF